MNSVLIGHAVALITIVVWGVTFINTKLLLLDFTPIEILCSRFVIGFIALCLLMPRRLPFLGLKRELNLAAAGFLGVTLYFLFENVALTYSQASNVGVIIGTVPFFTAIVDRLFGSKEPLSLWFFVGFVCAMCGICLMSLSSLELKFNPLGDLLALLASLTWAFYTLCLRHAGTYGFSMFKITRRIFLYGLICMVPFLFIFDFHFKGALYLKPINLGNLLFLGVGASAICFFTWSYAVKQIGPNQATPYLYLSPAVTVAAAMLVLSEVITPQAFLGMVLTISGLMLSELPQLRAYLKKRRELTVKTASAPEQQQDAER